MDQNDLFISRYDDPQKRIDNMMTCLGTMMYDEYEVAFHQNRSIITLIIKNIEICGGR